MNILKKTGKLEIFDPHKIMISIENSATDIGVFLNESDLKILEKDIWKRITKIRKVNGIISSYEVIGIIVEVLKENGYNNILKSYLEFSK